MLCLLTVSVLGNVVSADDWPMLHHDADHTGVTTSNGPLSDNILWNFSTVNVVVTSPAVANGYVYVSCGSTLSNLPCMVYCLNAQTGNLVWNFTTNYNTCSDPTVANGYVYLGSNNNYLYCLNAATGASVWNYSAGSYVTVSSPIVVNGYVYVGTGQGTVSGSVGEVLCINATTGVLVWESAALASSAGIPSLYGSNIYVGTGSGTVYCLSASAGTQVWNYTITKGGVAGAPVVYNNNVYFSAAGDYTHNYNITCLNAQTGTFVWSSIISLGVSGTVAVANGNVYVPSYGSALYCLNAQTGNQEWVAGTDGPVEGSPAVSANGYVYVGSSYGFFYCFDANNGEQLWSCSLAGGQSSPAIVNGILYVGGGDNVYAIGSTQPMQNATLSISASSKSISNPTEYKFTVTGTITPTQSGTVTVYESLNGSYLASSQETLTNGAYQYVDFETGVGIYQFYAVWPGDSQYNPSLSPIATVAVGVAAPTTPTLTLKSSSSSITPGQSVTLSGTISPSASGTISLLESINGSAFQQIATPSLSNGAYSYSYTISQQGTYEFQTSFAGNSQLNPAQSSTVTVAVGVTQPTTPTLTLKSSSSNVKPGQQVTLSGTISPSTSGTVSITLSINGSGYQQIASPTLNNGAYSYQYTISGPGNYAFQASFQGNSQYSAAQSASVSVSSSTSSGGTDYTWYIVGIVIVLIIIVIIYFLFLKPKSK